MVKNKNGVIVQEQVTGLTSHEQDLLSNVFKQFRDIEEAILFGSRAKGIAKQNSDIDLAITGAVDDLKVEKLAMELELLPLPYTFDVISLSSITSPELLEHIKRVGRVIYRNF